MKVLREYPFLSSINFKITNNGNVLASNHTIAQYGIGYRTNNIRVQIEGIPSYVFGPEGVIKCMKINGEWVYDE